MDLPITVPLSRPITFEDTTYDQLVIDEPDLDAQISYAELTATFADPPTEAQEMMVPRFWIARLADVPMKVAGKVKGPDLKAVDAALKQALGFRDANDGGDGGDELGNETPSE